jgi:hypothetical protein
VLLQCRAYLCILSNQVSDRRKIILCLLVGPNLSMGLGESFDGAPGNITAAKRYSDAQLPHCMQCVPNCCQLALRRPTPLGN